MGVERGVGRRVGRGCAIGDVLIKHPIIVLDLDLSLFYLFVFA